MSRNKLFDIFLFFSSFWSTVRAKALAALFGFSLTRGKLCDILDAIKVCFSPANFVFFPYSFTSIRVIVLKKSINYVYKTSNS